MTDITAHPEQAALSHGDEKDALYRIMDIPLILFNELSSHISEGEEEEVKLSGDSYRCRKINPRLPFTGFEGAICFRRAYEGCKCVLLYRYPEKRLEDSVGEPRPIFIVRSQQKENGVWAFGRGERITEEVRAELGSYGLSLQSEASSLIALCLLRCSEIARDPKCVSASFWEAERYPQGDFTKP